MPKRLTWAPSLDDISFELMTSTFYNHPRYNDLRRYHVKLHGEVIGTVESFRQEIRRKHGRILYGLIGNPKHWEASGLDRQRVGYRFYTRQDAAKALVQGSTA